MSPHLRLAALSCCVFFSATAATPSINWVPEGLPPFPPAGKGLGGFLKPEQGQAVLDAALKQFPDRASWDAYVSHAKQRI